MELTMKESFLGGVPTMEVNAHNMPAGTASPLHSSAVTSPEKHYVKAAVYIRLQWEQGRSDYDLT